MTRAELTRVWQGYFRSRQLRARLRHRAQPHALPSYVDRFGIVMFGFAVLLPLSIFLSLANHVRDGASLGLERGVLLFLHGFEAAWLDHVALVTSMSVTVIALIVLGWLLARRQWRTALFWLTAVGGAAIINSVVKKAIRRPRPELWDLVAPHSSFGFPSGHAMQSMAIAVALVVLFRHSKSRPQVLAVGCLFVLLVASCRMYLGLHYPTDVMAGWMLSLAWVTALAMLFDVRYLSIGGPFARPKRRSASAVADEEATLTLPS
jgi:membrane-associated phospholipid phosphatase